MKRSTKQVVKVLTLSGALGALGGLLSPPRLKRSTPDSLLSDSSAEQSEVSVAPETPEVVPPQEVKQELKVKKRTPAAPRSKTAAAAKPKTSSTARIPKTPTSRPDQAGDDQSGGSEK